MERRGACCGARSIEGRHAPACVLASLHPLDHYSPPLTLAAVCKCVVWVVRIGLVKASITRGMCHVRRPDPHCHTHARRDHPSAIIP